MFSNILSLLVIFALGILSKQVNLFSEKDASKFLKFVFYISAPSLILYSFSNFHFKISDLFLIFLGSSIPFIMLFFSYLIASLFKFEERFGRKSLGTFLVGSMIANTSLVIAISFSLFDKSGVVRAQMIDFGNALVTFSLTYFISAYYGFGEKKTALKKLFLVPALWAFALALFVSSVNFTLPTWLLSAFHTLALSFAPLILFSLGIYITLRFEKKLALALTGVFVRVLLGLFFGFLFVKLFKFSPTTSFLVLIAFSAPAGYNTLVFSSINKLDEKLASVFVSLCILLYVLLVPILAHFLI